MYCRLALNMLYSQWWHWTSDLLSPSPECWDLQADAQEHQHVCCRLDPGLSVRLKALCRQSYISNPSWWLICRGIISEKFCQCAEWSFQSVIEPSTSALWCWWGRVIATFQFVTGIPDVALGDRNFSAFFPRHSRCRSNKPSNNLK